MVRSRDFSVLHVNIRSLIAHDNTKLFKRLPEKLKAEFIPYSRKGL